MGEHAFLVSDWSTQNRLTLNVAKTKAIFIDFYFYINQITKMETKGVSFSSPSVAYDSLKKKL